MKLVSFEYQGRISYGVVVGSKVKDLGPMSADFGNDLKSLLERDKLEVLEGMDLSGLPEVELSQIRYLPVIERPNKILCIGINYATHVKETGRDMPTYPMIFTRFSDTQVAHGQALIRPPISNKLDFEGELAVIIGKKARYVKAGDALNYVAGYSCYNDGTVRDWQKHTIQFTPGKNFPQTGGFGPFLVTQSDIPDPQNLHLTTRLNGEIMQDTDTDDMIFSVEMLIEYCSSFTQLMPGDVIVSGTTGGVGAFRQPPVWMKPGDIVEVEISKIGTLRNTIAEED